MTFTRSQNPLDATGLPGIVENHSSDDAVPLGDSAFPDTEKCLFHAAIRFSHLHSRNDDREFPFKIYLDFPQP